MRQPHSIRFHLTAVFLLFFLLVVVLGLFSIWRLSNFNRLSADVAEVWLPNTRVLGDLNNFTSDFRAIEGSNLLSSDPAEIAATEKQMAELDRSIAEAERGFERIRRDAAEDDLYGRFKQRWNDYRAIVNQIVVLSRTGRKAEALAIYGGASRAAYDAASDTLGRLTDQAVANAQAASDRLGVAYRQAFWLILLGMVIAGVMVVAALVHISRSISAPLLASGRPHAPAGRQRHRHRYSRNRTARRDRRDGAGHRGVPQQRDRADAQPADARPARRRCSRSKLAQEQRLALAQRNFVSMASHEFRTPLTIVDGHARRLEKLRGSIAAPKSASAPEKSARAVLRLTHLIDNLLNSARLIDGGAELYFHPAEMDLTALLHEVCQCTGRWCRARRSSSVSARHRCRLSATPSCCSRSSAICCRTPSNIRPAAARSKSEAEVAADGRSSLSPIAASAFRPATSIGCSNAITAAATFPGSSGPASVFIWSRWRSTCTEARSRWTAEEGEGSRFVIRLPLKRAPPIGQAAPTRAARGARRSINCNLVGQHPMKTLLTLKLLLSFLHSLCSASSLLPPASAARRPRRSLYPLSAPLVQVDWQGPLSLPPRFRNHCAVDVLTGRPYCSDHCGFNYQFYFCSHQSFGCCRVGYGYCDWTGLLRCAP